MSEVQTQVALVEAAWRSLSSCRVIRVEQFTERWFVHGFNYWYNPALQRGFRGSMAPVFDIGLAFVEPGARFQGGDSPYAAFLEQFRLAPWLRDIVRPIFQEAPPEAKPQVEWIVVETALRALQGLWSGASQPGPRFLPRLVMEKGRVQMLSTHHESPLTLSLPTRADTPTLFDLPALAAPPSLAEILTPLRAFMASMTCWVPDTVVRLDYEVVEACLQGANLRTAEHEPPPLHRTYVATRTRSIIPGPIAGVTRIRVKRPDDPISDVLPSELALLRKDEKAGLANLLYGKPLLLEHEHEKDKIPLHKILICFIVDADAGALHHDTVASALSSRQHRYRYEYVYAKRQVFDLVRDLRDALDVVRRSAEVHVDVAIFALSAYQEDAVVYCKFSLDDIVPRQGSNAIHDRLQQLMSFSRVVPGFFDRAVSSLARLPHLRTPMPHGLMETHVGRFLRHEARRGMYRTIHVMPIGLQNLARFVTAAHHHLGFESITRHRTLLIAVNLQESDSDPQLSAMDEPQWQSSEAQTIHEAMRLATGGFPAIPLAALRHQVVELVFGEAKGRQARMQRVVQLADRKEP